MLDGAPLQRQPAAGRVEDAAAAIEGLVVADGAVDQRQVATVGDATAVDDVEPVAHLDIDGDQNALVVDARTVSTRDPERVDIRRDAGANRERPENRRGLAAL